MIIAAVTVPSPEGWSRAQPQSCLIELSLERRLWVASPVF
jgi:hypothetical protein